MEVIGLRIPTSIMEILMENACNDMETGVGGSKGRGELSSVL